MYECYLEKNKDSCQSLFLSGVEDGNTGAHNSTGMAVLLCAKPAVPAREDAWQAGVVGFGARVYFCRIRG